MNALLGPPCPPPPPPKATTRLIKLTLNLAESAGRSTFHQLDQKPTLSKKHHPPPHPRPPLFGSSWQYRRLEYSWDARGKICALNQTKKIWKILLIRIIASQGGCPGLALCPPEDFPAKIRTYKAIIKNQWVNS